MLSATQSQSQCSAHHATLMRYNEQNASTKSHDYTTFLPGYPTPKKQIQRSAHKRIQGVIIKSCQELLEQNRREKKKVLN
jgi:hypothetical protein